MMPTKTVVIDKLFGGRMHGKRTIIREDNHEICTYSATKIHFASDISSYVPGHIERYRRRQAVIGDTMVIYFCHSRHDNKRAFEMLTNYILRGARRIA